MLVLVVIESSDASRKECDFDKIRPGWTKLTVTDWVVNRDTNSVKATISLANPCNIETLLTKEKKSCEISYNSLKYKRILSAVQF